MLNFIWFALFLVAFISSFYQWLFLGNQMIFSELLQAIFDMATMAFEISFGLVGLLCFWLGMLKIAEAAGIVKLLSRALTPLFRRLMPEIPDHHPAMGSITMNMAANILGLDNAATPIGLKAMEHLQSLNPKRDIATNAQILLLVLNTSSVTLLPITVFLYRSKLGAADPTSVFIPILLATSASTLAGLLAVGIIQRLRVFNWVVLSYLGGLSLLLGSMMYHFVHISPQMQASQSSLLGNMIIILVVMSFLITGFIRRVRVYDVFIEGAKEGFQVAIRIIPYLVAMLTAVGAFRASHVLDGMINGIRKGVEALGYNTDFVPALTTAFMKPFSGTAARAMMIQTMQTYGVDSFPALVAAIMQGSTDTTFYLLAVYFGAVGVRYTRHAVFCGLIADVAGITASIFIAYWFFG